MDEAELRLHPLPRPTDAEVETLAVIRVPRNGPPPAARRPGRRTAFVEGFSLHADTWLHENDVVGLERLCNYGARGPLPPRSSFGPVTLTRVCSFLAEAPAQHRW